MTQDFRYRSLEHASTIAGPRTLNRKYFSVLLTHGVHFVISEKCCGCDGSRTREPQSQFSRGALVSRWGSRPLSFVAVNVNKYRGHRKWLRDQIFVFGQKVAYKIVQFLLTQSLNLYHCNCVNQILNRFIYPGCKARCLQEKTSKYVRQWTRPCAT